MNDAVCLAALISGMLGSMGLGGGSVLIIYLTVFLSVSQKEAQGINLLFFIPCAIISVLCNGGRGLVKFRTALFMITGGALGVLCGMRIFTALDSAFLGKIFGALIIVFGLVTLFSGKKKEK